MSLQQHPDLVQFDYTQYSIGRLTGPSQSSTSLSGFGYDLNGRLTSSALGNGTSGSTTLVYDTVGRMTLLSHNIAGTAVDFT